MTEEVQIMDIVIITIYSVFVLLFPWPRRSVGLLDTILFPSLLLQARNLGCTMLSFPLLWLGMWLIESEASANIDNRQPRNIQRLSWFTSAYLFLISQFSKSPRPKISETLYLFSLLLLLIVALSPPLAWPKDGERAKQEKVLPQQACRGEHTSNDPTRFLHDWLQSAKIIVRSHDIGKMCISYNG